MNHQRIISLAVCGWIAGLTAWGGEPEPNLVSEGGAIRSWGVAEGLPADSVTAIIQTRDGYLWVGTSAGLVRFDGVRFTRFKLPGTVTNAAVHVTALCEDASGSLWVGSQADGLFQREGETFRRFASEERLLDKNITSLAADAADSLWIGTRAGLNRWNGTNVTSFTSREGLADQNVSGVHVARSGAVWITTRSGMSRFVDDRIAPFELETDSPGRSPEYLGVYEDRRGNRWAFGDTYLINLATEKRFNYFRGAEGTSVRIWSLCEGRDGRLWIGTSGRGLFCFDDNKFQPVTLGALRWPYDVRAIYEDREGNLWLGTSGGGLIQLRPQTIHRVRVEQGLPPGAATCVALDSSGRVYVGMAQGGVFVGEAGRFERVSAGAGLELQSVATSLWVGPDGTLWIGTHGDGLYGVREGRAVQFTTAHGLGDNTVLGVCVTTNGSVWMGTRAGSVHQYNGTTLHSYGTENGLPGSPVTALLPSWDGGLWVGTQDGVLLRGDGERFNVVPVAWPVANRPILSLYESGLGSLWVGTDGAGVACRLGERWQVWNSLNGLPHDVVAGVADDAEGNIWLATGAGLCRVERGAIREAILTDIPLPARRVFDRKTSSGTQPDFGWPRVLRSDDGKLWFATPEGVLTLDPRGTEHEAAPLPVYIEAVSVNDQPLAVSPQSRVHSPKSTVLGADSGLWTWDAGLGTLVAPVRLPMNLRALDIQFTALHLAAPEELRFRYKLEGFDQDWESETSERRVRYGRLPYGEYKFRVAARKTGGDWIESGLPFAFMVPTPLHLTPAAIGLYVLTVMALVAGTVRVISHRRLRHALARAEQQQSLERERIRIARDMHDEIGSKLSKLSFLSERVRVDVTPDHPLAGKLETIAGTSRELLQTLDEIVWVVNPRNDNLEHLADYLGQYAREYFQNTNIECELRLPRTLPSLPVSAETRHNLFLAFEEALNNVLKHSGAARANVEMSVTPARFAISVADNGRGFPGGNGATVRTAAVGSRGRRSGNGLVNMRQRLESVGGQCVVENRPGAGVVVRLRIPLHGQTNLDS